MDEYLKSSLLGQYLRQAALSMKGVISGNNEYTFRCNLCGDSKDNKQKRRGHLRLYRGNSTIYWTYKCFNGDCIASGEGNAWNGERWLEASMPHIYNQYISELLTEIKTDYKQNNIEFEQKLKIEKENELLVKKIKEDKALEFFIEITDNNKLCKIAIDLCKKRLIPEEIWQKFFVALPGKDSIYSNRMIIPFYDKNDEIIYWQGRALYKDIEPKYLNRLSEKTDALYNIYNIDITKPVFVLEGIIDSLFIDNSVATLGLEIKEEMMRHLDKCKEVIYLFDGDKPGYNTAKKYLEKGKKVFLWDKFIKENKLPERKKWDINDVMIHFELAGKKLTYDDLEQYVSKNYYDLIHIPG